MSTSPVGASMPAQRRSRLLLRCLTALAVAIPGLAVLVPVAGASTVLNASLSGGTGTAIVGGKLYARDGAALSLQVLTMPDTQCVQLSGVFTASQTLAGGGRGSWVFALKAGPGDGVQTVTASAFDSFGANGCTGTASSRTASFVLDNTGPVVTGALTPSPNPAGWNSSDVAIAWSATDGGSGVTSGPTPAAEVQSADTAGVTRAAVAKDAVGNTSTGSVTVKLDKGSPVITGSRFPAPNAAGWNDGPVTVNFTCSDTVSGIRSCPGATTVSDSGAGQSVTGTAVDNAGNTSTATVSGINVDTEPPTLSGAPVTGPGPDGWYAGDVPIHWTAADAVSGLAGEAPADTTITGEGTAQTASASVSDRAGNSATATSEPVRIDRTPPTTTPSAPTDWTALGVTVALKASDRLSGVADTYYVLDDGQRRSGTSVAIASEGVHDLRFWSVDIAGNVEQATTIQVNVDGTAPAIHHTQSPRANEAGWNDSAVTVTFTCADGNGSGVVSCTGDRTVSDEGAGQEVIGTATDAAGNTATDRATVSIDTSPPTIDATVNGAANENGWYRSEVTVTYSCGDAVSGVASCPAAQTVGEGRAGSAHGTAKDLAGNAADTGVSRIDVDTTPPRLSGAADLDGAHHGWYRQDVRVHWSASDDLSGLDGADPEDSVVTGEGNDLSAAASVTDGAGNTTDATVTGIRIDRTAPTTQVSLPDAPTGWYEGSVLVTLTTGSDLSGIEATYYSVDAGPAELYTGPFRYSVLGEHTITYWSVDKAGNVEDRTAAGHSITLKVDGGAPTITGARYPAPNGYGWNDGPVLVSFACTDQGTGVTECPEPTTVSEEGSGQSVTGRAVDGFGTTSEATVGDIAIDRTPPTVTGAPTTAPNAAGWYRGDVAIHWTGQDALSGIDPAKVPADSVIDGEGSDLGAESPRISDRAGNTATGAVSGIRIDRTAPTITNTGVDATKPYVLGDPAIPASGKACNASDGSGSGVVSCVLAVTGGQPNGVGRFTFTATATDRAGNTRTQTGSYRVIYRWDGFKQPINDTAHQIDQGLSVFKGGSTVPAKLQLERADGTVVQASRPPQWLLPVKGSPTSALEGELLFSDTETSGTDFRWEAGSQQYQYNWSTKGVAAGYQYQVKVALDDGQVYYVTIGLR